MYEKRILLVDDDQQNLDLLKEILTFEGFTNIISAQDGEEALLYLGINKNGFILDEDSGNSSIDLVLLDVMMPGLSGFDVCQAAKQHHLTLPIVLITALDDDASNIRGIESGADDYITKPVNHKILLAKVKALLKQKHLGDEMLAENKNYRKLCETLPAYSLKSGDTINGYTIMRFLGQGASANVYLVEGRHHTACYALKILRAEESSPREVSAFRHEIETLMCLKHPNIVHIQDFGFHRGVPYFIMDYIDGIPLQQYINSVRPLPFEDIILFAKQIADALALVHGNFFLHRDIKAENIIVTFDGNAILSDFGIAKSFSFTEKSDRRGSLPYMSPEAIMGMEVTQQSDIYSFGILLYYMICGELPFTGTETALVKKHCSEKAESILLKRAETPPRLAELVERCIEKRALKRLSDINQALEILLSIELPSKSPSQD